MKLVQEGKRKKYVPESFGDVVILILVNVAFVVVAVSLPVLTVKGLIGLGQVWEAGKPEPKADPVKVAEKPKVVDEDQWLPERVDDPSNVTATKYQRELFWAIIDADRATKGKSPTERMQALEKGIKGRISIFQIDPANPQQVAKMAEGGDHLTTMVNVLKTRERLLSKVRIDCWEKAKDQILHEYEYTKCTLMPKIATDKWVEERSKGMPARYQKMVEEVLYSQTQFTDSWGLEDYQRRK